MMRYKDTATYSRLQTWPWTTVAI